MDKEPESTDWLECRKRKLESELVMINDLLTHIKELELELETAKYDSYGDDL